MPCTVLFSFINRHKVKQILNSQEILFGRKEYDLPLMLDILDTSLGRQLSKNIEEK